MADDATASGAPTNWYLQPLVLRGSPRGTCASRSVEAGEDSAVAAREEHLMRYVHQSLQCNLDILFTSLPVTCSVARGTEGNEILVRICPELTPMLDVMDLEIRHRAAYLAPPAITFQNAPVQRAVRSRIQANP